MTDPRSEWRGGEQPELLIRGARVVDPREGLDGNLDIRIDAGRTVEIGAGLDPGSARVIEASNMIAMPAFTDPHVHFRTPGQEHKESIATGTAAAAAGGYGLVIAMPNTTPPIDGPEIVRGVLARASTEAVVPMAQMGAITHGLGGSDLTEMAGMADAGAAGFTDDGMPVEDAGVLRRALRYQQATGRVLALHEEDPALSMGASLNEGNVSARLGLRGQPGVAESTMVARDIELAELEGMAIHVQHVSTAGSVRAIRAALDRGVNVTAEASPHHLLLTDEDAATLDSRRKMNPPLRGESDRLSVAEALADGTLTCVATDHAPHAADEKEATFEEAPFGTTGLETSFAALYTGLVESGRLELTILVERMTAGCIPFGFRAPRIAAGSPADITIFNPASGWTAGSDGWLSRSANSCFTGRDFNGRIETTIVEGVPVYMNGRLQ